MTRTLVLLLVAAFVLASTVAVVAGRNKTATSIAKAEDAKEIIVECEFGAGELDLTAGDIDEVATLEVYYDPDVVAYHFDYDERGSTGRLYMESDFRSHRHHGDDDSENRWNLVLSRKFPMELEFEVGACDADMDFGGLSISELSLEIGAASGTIEFTRPNPERMREFRVEAGASSVNMYDLGNANFEIMTFEGGAGSFDLDFRGEYHGESEVDIEIGLGSADIIIPRDLPVRIYADDDGWFSSVDFHGDDLEEVDDGVFESRGFNHAKDRAVFRIDVGMGSVDIHFKR